MAYDDHLPIAISDQQAHQGLKMPQINNNTFASGEENGHHHLRGLKPAQLSSSITAVQTSSQHHKGQLLKKRGTEYRHSLGPSSKLDNVSNTLNFKNKKSRQ